MHRHLLPPHKVVKDGREGGETSEESNAVSYD